MWSCGCLLGTLLYLFIYHSYESVDHHTLDHGLLCLSFVTMSLDTTTIYWELIDLISIVLLHAPA